MRSKTKSIEKEKSIVDNKITIKIELPDAKSPKEMGISEDSRKLGLAIESLMVMRKKC